ncbi:MAG: transketolase [Erysipelotrichaceae bacterium]|nr:transketolase [Erysipelotrichaceae bacterium]
MDINQLKDHALNIRRNIVKMVYNAQSGHPGGSLGAADIMTYLYFVEMNVNKDNVSSIDRDRFVLSKGHCSPGLYATLYEAGLMDEDLMSFRQIDSKLQGHPNMTYVDGVDMSTGSLGQGISCAVGMAIANKLDDNGNRVYVLCGDGESEEGIVWEALMAACHYKLDDLCIIFDQNGLQIDGNVQDVIGPLPLADKAKAFGAEVVECDGNDYDSLAEAFDRARKTKGVPTVIIAHTVKGKGVSYMENNYAWHGAAPKEEDYKIAMEDLKEVR